jgi:hypothetical protein
MAPSSQSVEPPQNPGRFTFGSHKGTLESLNDEEIYLIFELLDNLENKNSND